MDGVDAVLCDITQHTCVTLAAHSVPYPHDLLLTLNALCVEGPDELNTLAIADRRVAETFADAALGLLDKVSLSPHDITAIGSHGQTVRHHPNSDVLSVHFSTAAVRGFSCQIGDPNTIAVLTGIDVVADFRRKDIALGGQGAPLVPAFHNAVFAHPQKYRALVNIGGIANVSLLSPTYLHAPPKGFDTGPGNTLMDKWISLHLNKSFDENGQWAASGQVHKELLTLLLQDPYFSMPPPKSTGREYFNIDWLSNALGQFSPSLAHTGLETPTAHIAPQDIQATLLMLTATTIAQDLKHYFCSQNEHGEPSEVIVCGGGAFNQTLMTKLSNTLTDVNIYNSHVLKIHPQHVEGAAFAWLAYAFMNDIPANVPEVTGASKAAVLGGLYKKG